MVLIEEENRTYVGSRVDEIVTICWIDDEVHESDTTNSNERWFTFLQEMDEIRQKSFY